MSELAFNINGEAFDLPATATGWRVRRMRPRGAPEVVYGRDGAPLIVPAEAGLEELRQFVGAAGKYRLDAIDERGRTIDKLPASYVIVPPSEDDTQVVAADGPRTIDGSANTLVAEAMRLNTELAKSVVERFPQMVQAAAELLRAADGAGLPSRAPRVRDEDVEEADGDDLDDEVPPAGFDLNSLVAQVMPLLVGGLASGKLKMPNVGEMLDWRKAAKSSSNNDSEKKPTKERLGPPTENEGAGASAEQSASLPPIDAATMAHFISVQSMLTPEESALAREVAAELKPAELRAWFDELSKLDVAEAAAKIRKVVGGAKGGAS